MEFVPAVALAALVVKFTGFLKYLSGKDWNGAVTQLIVWIAGIGAVVLVGASDWANALVVGGIAADDMNFASQALLGLEVASGGAFLYDFKKAVDNSDSAGEPKLLNE